MLIFVNTLFAAIIALSLFDAHSFKPYDEGLLSSRVRCAYSVSSESNLP